MMIYPQYTDGILQCTAHVIQDQVPDPGIEAVIGLRENSCTVTPLISAAVLIKDFWIWCGAYYKIE